MTVQVEEGRWYRRRKGDIAGPMEKALPTTGFQFRDPTTGIYYTAAGGISPNGSAHPYDFDHECDASGTPIIRHTTSHSITVSGMPGSLTVTGGITVQEGRCYQRRDGHTAGPMRASGGGSYPFRCSRTGKTYTAQGYEYGPASEGPHDLMWEIPAPATGAAGTPEDIGDLVTRALATKSAKESAELERMRALPTAEQRLEEYRRKVAKLAERGNLY